MKTLAPRIARALRRRPRAVERLMERWLRHGRADAFRTVEAALPKSRRNTFRRLAAVISCTLPLSDGNEAPGVGWLLAFPTEGRPDAAALAEAIGQAADPRLWRLTLGARPWDAAALRAAGHPAWRAALEALLDDREMPTPVAPKRRQVWLLAAAGPVGDGLPFPGVDIWGPGGLADARLDSLIATLSDAAGVRVRPPTLVPDVLDWAIGADALDALCESVQADAPDGLLHLHRGEPPEAILTDALGRPLRRLDLSPVLAAGVPPDVVVARLLSMEDGPTPVLHRLPDTLPRPGWLH
jgi:hypothetical protein